MRTLVQREMGEALSRCSLLLSPVAPSAAYRLGEQRDDPLAMYKGKKERAARAPPPRPHLCALPVRPGTAPSLCSPRHRAHRRLPACKGLSARPPPRASTPERRRPPTPFAPGAGDLMTVNLNLSGLPGVAVPCGFAPVEGGGSMPVGLQMIGRAFGEADLLRVAHVFELTSGGFARGTPAVHTS